MTAPGIPNNYVLSTSCFGDRLRTIEDQAFAAVAMGFRAIELGLSESPVPLTGFEDTRRETGVRLAAVVAGCLRPRVERMPCTMLSSPRDEEREQAKLSIRRHIQLAQRLGAPYVVLRGSSIADPKMHHEAEELTHRLARTGINDELREEVRGFVARLQKKGQRQIDHLCRSLHSLRQEFPETRLALEPGVHIDDLLSFDGMGWVLEDLAKQEIGYWHDVGRIHMRERAGLPSQGQWLDTYASKMVGIHLQDAADQEAEMPPGLGEVDFKLIASYIPSAATRVVEVNPRHGRAELLGSVQFLNNLGI
ncbi:MAG TPA: TIM barrel protein [Planctomycetota bacterium]|nr:TIM barrel protein [Planctomycetota bacterium]